MAKQPLLTHKSSDGILTVTMNRPEVHNAFDDHQVQRLIRVLNESATDRSVRVVILAGAGKSFSAGGDIDYMRRMGYNTHEANLADAKQLATLMQVLYTLPKPTIARVNGAAMGGGVGLVCCRDFAVGSQHARFATSEVRIGMVAATIGPYVVSSIGEKAARRLFMSALSVNAEQALSLGLLSQQAPEEELDCAVAALAKTLIQNAPRAVSLSKQLSIDVAGRPISKELIDNTIALIADVRGSTEGREGLAAFLEKQTPGWAMQSPHGCHTTGANDV